MMEMPTGRREEIGRMRCFIILVCGVELQLLIDHTEKTEKKTKKNKKNPLETV